MSEIAERILKAMQELDMSYGDLSSKTGISKAMLQRYATGEVGKIPLDRMTAIAEALGMTPQELIGWNTENTYTVKKEDYDRLEALHQNPRLGLLFDRVKDLDEEDIQFMEKYANAVIKERDGD